MSNVSAKFETVVAELLEKDESINSVADVNDGYCSIVASEVYERLGEPDDVRLCVDVNKEHYWLECNGLFYDAERPDGVSEWRELPYWKRHPEPSDFEYDFWVKHTGF